MKQILLLVLILFNTKIDAQDYAVYFQNSNPFKFGKTEVWNFEVLNTTPSNLDAIIQVEIFNLNNKKIYTSISSSINLSSGINAFDISKIGNTNSNYFSNFGENSDLQTGSFPAGNYQWCISILSPTTKEVKYNTCSNVTVEIPTKPILVYPCNGCVLSEFNPMFSWLGANLQSSVNTNYRISISEVEKNQNIHEAIFRNRPVLQQSDITSTNLMYPFNSPSLEVGKQYAWKIDLINTSGQISATTEVWSFSLKLDSSKSQKAAADDSYLDIVSSAPNILFTVKDEIRLKFISRKFPSVLAYKIFKENENGNITDGELQVLSKENWYSIDLSGLSRLKTDETYKLELSDGFKLYKFYFKYIKQH